MLLRKTKKINKRILLILIGSFLISISSSFIINKYYNRHEIKQLEEENIEEFFEVKEEQPIEEIKEQESEKLSEKTNYISILEIPKINLKRGLVDPNSWKNNINYNIEILKESQFPNIEKGNFILAAHSGNSYISYFKNLHKLNRYDKVYVYYNNYKYTYEIVNKYDIEKTGKAEIKRNKNKNTITLITCRHSSNYQIVVIAELIEGEPYNG